MSCCPIWWYHTGPITNHDKGQSCRHTTSTCVRMWCVGAVPGLRGLVPWSSSGFPPPPCCCHCPYTAITIGSRYNKHTACRHSNTCTVEATNGKYRTHICNKFHINRLLWSCMHSMLLTMTTKGPKDTANTAKTKTASAKNRTREKRFNETFSTISEPAQTERGKVKDSRYCYIRHFLATYH